jgi:ureidoglycolate hydrolase
VDEAAGRIKAVPLSKAAWEPFGWIPVADTDPHDGENRLSFEWGDPHVNLIGHALDEVRVVAGGLRCEVFYRHDTHTQALMPLDSAAIIAVAPATVDFSNPADADAVRAFLLHPLQTIVLRRGTWHWGPFPVGAGRVTLFNVQGFRYEKDNTRVDLAARGLSVDVLLTSAPS